MGFSNDWAGNDRTNNYALPAHTAQVCPAYDPSGSLFMKLITAFHTPVD